MMRRAILCVVSLGLLSGCNLLFPEDPREGAEPVAECVKRVTGTMTRADQNILENMDGTWTPTFTYDVTKLDLEAIQELTVPGSDETAGSRAMQATNEASTAVDRFMEVPVDEKGAFFLGRDPALYRVRGEPMAFDTMLTAGCERQKADMRLIELSWDRAPKPTKTESDIDPNELDSRGEPMEQDS